VRIIGGRWAIEGCIVESSRARGRSSRDRSRRASSSLLITLGGSLELRASQIRDCRKGVHLQDTATSAQCGELTVRGCRFVNCAVAIESAGGHLDVRGTAFEGNDVALRLDASVSGTAAANTLDGPCFGRFSRPLSFCCRGNTFAAEGDSDVTQESEGDSSEEGAAPPEH